GGRFVSVTVALTEDPVAPVNAKLKARILREASGGFVFHVIQDFEDEIYYHARGDSEVGDVDFDYYHLRKSLYEVAAREAE
ncbi:hypothetical protein MMC29_001246, partial [Sticta canariensis]|nr:hypothetical protein [Sticta canariensis]